MKRQRNVNLLLMLVLLVAVGQMAQTIYIPAIADMARDLNVREGAVQSVMGAYLLTYGVSQLFYGPISDRVGRRPVILVGMSIFMLATLVAVTTSSLTVLIAASAMQGMGTGVGGVMARTLPRDLYERTQLRHANSLLNMGILVSPLLAPLIGGLLDTMWNWRACYLFLLVLCAGVTFSMARWMPETRPVDAPRTRLLTSYKTLFEAERRREAEQTRILAERQIQETEIEREQAVRSRKVEAEREVRIKEIEQQQVTEIANQTKSIAIAAKSEQQSQAEARANLALAEAVSAQQNVETTRQTAEADRAKQVALIAAAQDAETKAVELTVRAKAEKEAAEMQAAAIVELAEATRKKGLAEAEAQRALNDAINVLSDEQTSLKFKLALLQALPAVIEKSVEPMKSIDGIKIIQVDGLNRGSAAGDANTGNVGGGNLAEQALSAALSYRTQAPLIDSLLNEIGVSGGSLAALTSPLTSTTPVAENVE